jgi:hypothetical protein
LKLTQCKIASLGFLVASGLLSTIPAFAQAQPTDQQKQDPAQPPAPAPAPAGDSAATEALAKAAQNPVASMISVPFQNNTSFGVGPFERDQNILNIQPVIPVRLSDSWNLISRTIVPIVWQPNTAQPTQGWFGFGDLNPQFYFSPSKASKLIWGAGPQFLVPTATSQQLGLGKFGIGPSVVVLTTPGHWVIGALANNIWSVAGPEGRANVNQMVFQWFINYNMKKGWYVVTSPVVSANWEASSGNVWNVPLGGGVGRIMKMGNQPINITAQFYGNAVHPIGASPWGMRLQVQLLFPKLSKQQEKEMLEQKLKQLDQQQPQKN